MGYKVTTELHSLFAPAMTQYPLGGGHHILAWTDDDRSLNAVQLSEDIGAIINPPAIEDHPPHILPSGLEQESSIGQPALAEFNGRLFIAWTGTDGAGLLNVMSSADGVRWDPTTKRTLHESSMAGPALAAHAGRLFMAWTGKDGNGTLSLMSSTDGSTFDIVARDLGQHSIDGSPSLASAHGSTTEEGHVTQFLYIGWTERGTNKAKYGPLFQDGTFAPDLAGSGFAFSAPQGTRDIITTVPFVLSPAPFFGFNAWWIDGAQHISSSTWDLGDPGLGSTWTNPRAFADTTDQPPAVRIGTSEIAWRGLDAEHSLNISEAGGMPTIPTI
jgi:hypothetical protein